MRKIKARRGDKSLWVTRELFDKLKTLKVLGIDTFEAIGCDINHTSVTTYLDYGRDRLRVEYHGGKQWSFTIDSSWEYNGRETVSSTSQRWNSCNGLQQGSKPGWKKP